MKFHFMTFFKKTYQEEIIGGTKNFRPKDNYTIYPPYHTGPYIEEYFFNYFISNKIITERIYIPIFWTNINNNSYYSGNDRIRFSKYLKTLDQNEKYFTVCQHEDFSDVNNLEPTKESLENLPKDIIIFSGSGKLSDKVKLNNIIPIPHVVSPIPNPILDKKRDIFCSFIGANTHPVRNKLYEIFKDDKDFHIEMDKWNVSVNKEKENLFKDITERSVFTLCPRGNGPTSYRMWEAMQLGSIPVYIYDNKWIPLEDEIKWDDFSIFFSFEEIIYLKTYLMNIPQNKISEMVKNAKEVYEKYFTMDKVCENIIKKINVNNNG